MSAESDRGKLSYFVGNVDDVIAAEVAAHHLGGAHSADSLSSSSSKDAVCPSPTKPVVGKKFDASGTPGDAGGEDDEQ